VKASFTTPKAWPVVAMRFAALSAKAPYLAAVARVVPANDG
jgi:hypothetical protein